MMIDKPHIGTTYYDFEGRELFVTQTEIGDLSGREVRGILDNRNDYSCDLKIWREVWLEQKPPTDPLKMKV
jgi:hypothetical protein